MQVRDITFSNSISYTLSELKSFVKYCKKNLNNFAGINVCISKEPNTSYLIAKSQDSLMPEIVLKFKMDYASPIERPLIADAIYSAMYDRNLSPESMENHMVCVGEQEIVDEDLPENLH